MATRKTKPVEMKVAKLGIVREMNFPHECFINVALNKTDYGRILDVLRKYVAKDFPEDKEYNEALKIVCSKLKRKEHRLIMREEVFFGTGIVKLDHDSAKVHTITAE